MIHFFFFFFVKFFARGLAHLKHCANKTPPSVSDLSFPVFFFFQLTYADIAFVEFFQSLKVNVDIQKEKEKKEDIEEILKKFSLLYEYYKRVLAVEEIKTCIEKRPQSDYWASCRRDICLLVT